jgi:hypothetical protein
MAKLNPSGEVRTEHVVLRLSPTEKKQMEREAKAAKLRLSEWMRMKLLKKRS